MISRSQGLKRGKRLMPACVKNEGYHGIGWSHQQIDKEDLPESERSLMKIRNRTRLRSLPWGHSSLDRERRLKDSVDSHTLAMRVEKVINLRVQLPWIPSADSLESKARCQIVSKTRGMSRETALISCLTLRASIHCWESRSSMSKLEWPGLNPNWWFEMRLLDKRYDFMSTAMMHSTTLLMFGRKLKCRIPCSHKPWWMPAWKKKIF